MLDTIVILLSLVFYPAAAIFFVVVTKKCFIKKMSPLKAIVLFFLSPSATYFLLFCVTSDFLAPILEPDTGNKSMIIMRYIMMNSGVQVLIQLVILLIYNKLVKAKNPSIAMFVYICSVMFIPNIFNMLMSYSRNLVPIICYVITHILFYKMVVLPLSDLTKSRKVTDTRLFVILPLVTYVYNVVMNALLMFIIGYKYLDYNIGAESKIIKSMITDEKSMAFYNFLVDKYVFDQKSIVDIVLYSCIFTVFVLIIAFYVIVRNIRFMNEVVDKQQEIKTLSVEVMEALAHTIDAKDEYTRGHSIRVAKYSKMIAEKMELSKEECENIYYMGLLHDIGKIGVPNEIINKPAKLTDEEYDVIKTHPMTGFDILAEIKSRPDLATGARWHHERFDGKGYPDNKRAQDIPLEARIIAVADSYDAMTSNRSYRKYLPQNVVREEIEKNIGSQFDEKPARCMLAIMDEDKEYVLHE